MRRESLARVMAVDALPGLLEALGWMGLVVLERVNPRVFSTTVDEHFASLDDDLRRWMQDREGAEVDDDETWQHHLGNMIDATVLNYGVSGHGTWQAVLKWKRHAERGEVYPVTLLGIHEEDLERSLNGFRPFLWPHSSGEFAFQPFVRCPEEGCVPYPNFLPRDATTIAHAIAAAHQAAAADHWAHWKPVLGFPYLWNLGKMTWELGSRGFIEGEHIWLRAEGDRAMEYIVETFLGDASSAGTRPVLLFFPDTVNTAVTPGYTGFVERLRERHPDITVVDTHERDFAREKFNVKPFDCHASDYGNRIVAQALFETAFRTP